MLKSKRFLASLLAVLMLMGTLSIPAFATEVVAVDSSTVLNEENGIQPYGEFTTFVTFKNGWQSTASWYSFTISKSCVMKAMMGVAFANNASGSVSVMLMHTGNNNTYTLTFTPNGANPQEFNKGKTIPAGTYNVLVSPSNYNAQFIASGCVYCMNY